MDKQYVFKPETKAVGNDILKQVTDLLDTYNMRMSYQISFPQYNILPEEVKLALLVLEKNGMKITFTLEHK